MNEDQLHLLDHYKNPQNYGDPGFEVTSKSVVENQTCGDKIEVYLNTSEDTLFDLTFKAEGCSISIGTMSILTEELKGKSLEEIRNMSYEDIHELIKIELTPSRIRCATLGLEAVQKAINEL